MGDFLFWIGFYKFLLICIEQNTHTHVWYMYVVINCTYIEYTDALIHSIFIILFLVNKSCSLDLYRPPALRNSGIENIKRPICNATDKLDVHPSAATTSESSSITITTATTTTSISCNNSPIRRKENANSILNSDADVDSITSSTQQNSFDSKQKQQTEDVAAADFDAATAAQPLKQPQRLV